MRRFALAAPLLTLLPLAACGGGSSNTQTMSGLLEDLPTIPAKPTPDAKEYHLADQMIPAGHDKQFCHYLEIIDHDMYISQFDTYQGKFGHHLVLFKAIVTEKPGTVRECSTAEDMIRFRPIMAAARFGYDKFPDGFAVFVEKGTQLVLQQHYVNTSSHDILVRDAAHLVEIEAAAVKTLVGFLGLSQIDFALPPGMESTLRFDCKVPYDTNLVVIGPHMHEWGTRFTADIGPPGALTSIINIPEWKASMRDTPPLNKYGTDTPRPVHKNDIIRTACTFKNTTRGDLKFPQEMCATFGYFMPAERGHDEFICDGS